MPLPGCLGRTALALLAACSSTPTSDVTWVVGAGAAYPGSGGLDSYDPGFPIQVSMMEFNKGKPWGVEMSGAIWRTKGEDAGGPRDIDIGEFGIGPVYRWRMSHRWNLLTGAGLRVASASLYDRAAPDSLEDLDSDSSWGGYAHVGLFWRAAGELWIGLDARWADGEDYNLDGVQRDAGLTQWLFCFRWAP